MSLAVLKQRLQSDRYDQRWAAETRQLLLEHSQKMTIKQRHEFAAAVNMPAGDSLGICGDCGNLHVHNHVPGNIEWYSQDEVPMLWTNAIMPDGRIETICLNCLHAVVQDDGDTIVPYHVYKYVLDSPYVKHYKLVEGARVLNYTFPVHNVFNPQNPKLDRFPKFMGVEYETLLDTRKIHKIYNLLDRKEAHYYSTDSGDGSFPFQIAGHDLKQRFGPLAFKSDSSISSGNGHQWGIEIVTAPGTYEFQHKAWNNFWNSPYALAFTPNGTCGMHVHMAKVTMRPLTVSKLIPFWNGDAMHDFLTALCGRNSDNASYGKRQKDAKASDFYKGRIFGRGALSTENNKGTIEIRAMASPQLKPQFMARLELCRASADFAASDGGLRDMVPTKFINFVKANRSRFPYLAATLHNWENGRQENPFKEWKLTDEQERIADRIG